VSQYGVHHNGSRTQLCQNCVKTLSNCNVGAYFEREADSPKLLETLESESKGRNHWNAGACLQSRRTVCKGYNRKVAEERSQLCICYTSRCASNCVIYSLSCGRRLPRRARPHLRVETFRQDPSHESQFASMAFRAVPSTGESPRIGPRFPRHVLRSASPIRPIFVQVPCAFAAFREA
jgi:hypothetical protein